VSKRGWNLRAGEADGRRGRRKGGIARAEQENNAARDWPCEHCQRMGYTTKSQCWGHRGFAAVMQEHPEALHSLAEKIARTGRADSRARWIQVSG
jgi:hypothetical protein